MSMAGAACAPNVSLRQAASGSMGGVPPSKLISDPPIPDPAVPEEDPPVPPDSPVEEDEGVFELAAHAAMKATIVIVDQPIHRFIQVHLHSSRNVPGLASSYLARCRE